MNKEDKVKYFEFLVNSYDKGTASIKGDHPDEVRLVHGGWRNKTKEPTKKSMWTRSKTV